MIKKTLALALAATMGVALAACGSQRAAIDTVGIATQQTPAANEPSVTARLNAIAEATADWSTLSAGGTIGIGGAKSFSSKMQMRMERGKSIYISLRPLLGIEVGRLVVVGDSVIVIDKLHKRYIAANASLLTNGVPVDVTTLQDIFLGRPFVLGEGTFAKRLVSKVKMTRVDGSMVMEPRKQYAGFTYSFTFDTDNQMTSANVTPSGSKTATYSVKYADVKTSTPAGNVAGSVSAATKVKGQPFELYIDYGGMSWNEGVKIDTKVPGGYTRVDSKQLLNMLGSK